MQGFNRHNLNYHKTNFDNSICHKDGIYSPNINHFHTRSFKSGDPFPLYRGKIVRWLLIDKTKEFILCKN